MQSLPSSLYAWFPALIAALCIMDTQSDRPTAEELRGRYLWARDQSYCRRDAERRSGRERDQKLGWAKSSGGGSYLCEMVKL